jgi:hypothetical protein
MLTPEDYAQRLMFIGHRDSDGLVIHVRQQCAALLREAIKAERERIAARFDLADQLDPNEWFPPGAIARAIRELPES